MKGCLIKGLFIFIAIVVLAAVSIRNNFYDNGSICFRIKVNSNVITWVLRFINQSIEETEMIDDNSFRTAKWIKEGYNIYKYYYRSDYIYIDAEFNGNTGILSMQYGVLCHSDANKDTYIL